MSCVRDGGLAASDLVVSHNCAERSIREANVVERESESMGPDVVSVIDRRDRSFSAAWPVSAHAPSDAARVVRLCPPNGCAYAANLGALHSLRTRFS